MLDRTVAPAFRQIGHISIKQPDKYPISSGIDLYVLKAGTQPVIKLELILEAGKWYERKAGAALFSGKMLSDGAGEMRSFDISQLFDSLGAQLEITPALDFMSITIYTLEEYLIHLLPVLKLLIKEPVFPGSELEILKNIEAQKLRINLEKNSFMASRKLRESLFGNTHPYGQILQESDIRLIARNDLVQHFKKTVLQKPFTLIASGNFNEDTVKDICDTFCDISVNSQKAVSNNHPPEPVSLNVSIDKNDSSQTSIRFGCLSIPITHHDYPRLLITNEILGGYFGSRLMKNIREEKGLTYGIFSSLIPLKHGSFTSISADVKKEFREQAFEEICLEIKSLRTEKVSKEELETVKNYMLGHLQASISTPFALAAKFKKIFLHGLGYEYYSNLIDTIKTITPEDILNIANKYLPEDKMSRVYVG